MNFFKYIAFSTFFVLISTTSNAAYFTRKITALRTFIATPSRNLCTAWKLKRDAWIALNNAQQAAAAVAQKNAQKQCVFICKHQAITKSAALQQPTHIATTNTKTHIPSSDQTQSPLVARSQC